MRLRFGMFLAVLVLPSCTSQTQSTTPLSSAAIVQPRPPPSNIQQELQLERDNASLSDSRVQASQAEASRANSEADACMKRYIASAIEKENPDVDDAVGMGMLVCINAWRKYDELQEHAEMLVRLSGGSAGSRGFQFELRERDEKRRAHYRQLAVVAISERNRPKDHRPAERLPPSAAPRQWEERI